MVVLPRRARAVSGMIVLLGLAAACAKSDEEAPPGLKLPERVDLEAGADAETGAGDAATDAKAPPQTCTNGKKDADETDVDCGGASCGPCANGKSCATRRDCASLVCAATKCSGDIGCSDGTREGFAAIVTYPNIAACSGGWSVPGLLAITTLAPACARVSGNDSPNPGGAGCGVADLCQPGWHVCESASDVGTKAGGAGCTEAATAGAFFVTRQSGSGAAQCGAGANDLFGCGAVGATPDANTCGALTKFSNDLCVDLPSSFVCGADGAAEADNVTKSSSDGGGALCCRD